ncbi:MAG: single-stranded DNA-binding protein [Clostridiales bacterium]|jgi:hypothetical protein|nr:single-stranded DNA-binding protein [Clostridiales bacterium]
MNTYQEWLDLIETLPSGTEFSLGQRWREKKGIRIGKTEAIRWGRDFFQEYKKYNVKFLGKNSANLCMYKKL